MLETDIRCKERASGTKDALQWPEASWAVVASLNKVLILIWCVWQLVAVYLITAIINIILWTLFFLLCPLWNFLSPLLQSTSFATANTPLTSYSCSPFCTFCSLCLVSWIQHSCFPEIVHIISASPSIITFCFYSVQVFCFPKQWIPAQLHPPSIWRFPWNHKLASTRAMHQLEHQSNVCRSVSLLTGWFKKSKWQCFSFFSCMLPLQQTCQYFNFGS